MDPVHTSCQETLPRHLAQRSCSREDCLKRSRSDPRRILCTILPRAPPERSYPQIMRTDSATPSRERAEMCVVLLEVLPRGLAQDLQRFALKGSCSGCSLLVEGALRDPGQAGKFQILPTHLAQRSCKDLPASILRQSGSYAGPANIFLREIL